MQNLQNQVCQLRGFITELDFTEAEKEFPGIIGFYYASTPRPPTFLDLLAAFIAWRPSPNPRRIAPRNPESEPRPDAAQKRVDKLVRHRCSSDPTGESSSRTRWVSSITAVS